MKTTTTTMIDPPQGYLYGFPKEYDKSEEETCNEWLVKNGYPQEIIDDFGDHFYCRFWVKEEINE